ncbi:hypothetical protein BDR05DRAFT_962281 [Suillus weaverae]|nr:hypothetical protein BDR05DRAFT_962281 [Suillus weaverae]
MISVVNRSLCMPTHISMGTPNIQRPHGTCLESRTWWWCPSFCSWWLNQVHSKRLAQHIPDRLEIGTERYTRRYGRQAEYDRGGESSAASIRSKAPSPSELHTLQHLSRCISVAIGVELPSLSLHDVHDIQSVVE